MDYKKLIFTGKTVAIIAALFFVSLNQKCFGASISSDTGSTACILGSTTLTVDIGDPDEPDTLCCDDMVTGFWSLVSTDYSWSGDASGSDSEATLNTTTWGTKNVTVDITHHWECSGGATEDTYDSASITIDVFYLRIDGASVLADLCPGDSETLTVSEDPYKGSSFSWESSDSDVLSVDGDGQIYANAPGTATITVTDDDSGCTASLTLGVVHPLSISGPTVICSKNGTITLSASGGYPSVPYKWNSSNASVASLDSSTGDSVQVTGVNAGTVSITLSQDGSGACTPSSLSITVIDAITVTGDKIVLTTKPSLFSASGGSAPYSWNSNNTSKATVSPTGLVTGISPSASINDVTIKAIDSKNCSGEVNLTVAKIELENPKGDPVTAPVDDQNEFTFSDATPGILTIICKAKVTPNISGVVEFIKNDVSFTIDAINGSTRAWDNPGANPATGKPTVVGNFLQATVKFTTLPTLNGEFGKKLVSVNYNGNVADKTQIEVFFPKFATNHPGGQAGSPNWFYYWGQVVGCKPNVVYVNDNARFGRTPGMRLWSYTTAQNKTQVIIYDLAATVDNGDKFAKHGQKRTTGIDTFEDTFIHESKHVDQIAKADAILTMTANTPWQFGWAWNQGKNHNHWTLGPDNKPGKAGKDDDKDGTIDNLIITGPGELGSGDDVLLDDKDDWPIAFGPKPPQPWAGGSAIEDPAYNSEPDTENARAGDDWGNPGKQHKTVNKYDD